MFLSFLDFFRFFFADSEYLETVLGVLDSLTFRLDSMVREWDDVVLGSEIIRIGFLARC